MAEFFARYWLEALCGLLASGLALAFQRLVAIRHGVKALLRDRIVQAYAYYTDRGYCPIYARDTIEELYLQYHRLGGNGTVTKLHDRLCALPTKEGDDLR